MKNLIDLLPIYGVEHDSILSRMGDVTIAFKVQLPEIFTLSNEEYEAFHHAWIRAIKVLPVQAIMHKQDWFTEATYQPSFTKEDTSFFKQEQRPVF